MDISEIENLKDHVIQQYGQRTAHNIQLQDDIYTIRSNDFTDESQVKKIV